MIHSWRCVKLGRQNQFPLAKFFLGVGVGEFVPAIYRGKQIAFKYIKRTGEQHTYQIRYATVTANDLSSYLREVLTTSLIIPVINPYSLSLLYAANVQISLTVSMYSFRVKYSLCYYYSVAVLFGV